MLFLAFYQVKNNYLEILDYNLPSHINVDSKDSNLDSSSLAILYIVQNSHPEDIIVIYHAYLIAISVILVHKRYEEEVM